MLQAYVGTVVAYLNVFPLFNHFFSQDADSYLFLKYQTIVILCFEAPLILASIGCSKNNIRFKSSSSENFDFHFSFYIFLMALLSIFWYVAIQYDLFFRRQGHEGLVRATLSVPIILLYIYRATVESSFFIINILVGRYFQQKAMRQKSFILIFVLTGYVSTFISFYISNSRMHVVLLVLTLLCFQPQLRGLFKRKISFIGFAIFIVPFLIGITILREVVFEKNDRLEDGSVNGIIISAFQLIASRLDPLHKLYELDRYMPDLCRFDMTGYSVILNLNKDAVKESMQTSVSVLIANSMNWSNEIDFPKTMFLDSFLSFGVLGAGIISLVLGAVVGWSQIQLLGSRVNGGRSMLGMYLFTIALQFEKEFVGFLISVVKWSPVFFLCLLLTFRHKSKVRRP